MPLSTIRFDRPLSSYSKVVLFMSAFLRGHKWGIKRKRTRDLVLLNVGCGPFAKPDYINLDYNWNSEVDIVWDITAKPYPIQNNSLEGIYTEHCLEHISYENCLKNLQEFYRMLKPGGTLRIVVPDAQIYLDLYQARKTDKSISLPYSSKEATPIISINRIFRAHGHLFIYDFETFAMNLEKTGFKNIKKESFRSGRDPRLLIDQKDREVESLYVEASK